MVKILGLILLGVVVLILLGILYGGSRWQAHTQALLAGLNSQEPSPTHYDPSELEGLPAPVQRYFRTVLSAGQPLVQSVRLKHKGTFNLSASGEQWRPFTSEQWVTTRSPGFLWNAQVTMAPGMMARVHDAYIQGEGILHATLFGLIPLVNLRDRDQTATGELMRWFAETPWYPTALLPSQGVRWDPVDNASAWATYQDGPLSLTALPLGTYNRRSQELPLAADTGSASPAMENPRKGCKLLFRFNEAGLIQSVRAEARGRTVNGEIIPTPWEGHWSNYERRQGLLVPTSGEVAWILPDGAHPYWRGQITETAYEFSQ
ncbi:MAG: hypothetical protein Q6L60_14035 [Thermostichus sp. HHBFW_bins_43]